MEALRILCVGAGAIGTYLAGSLALQGHKVIVVEKGERADDLKKRGLRLWIGGKLHKTSLEGLAVTLEDAVRLGPFDIGFIAVKGYGTLSLANSLVMVRDNLPDMICFQNGIGHEAGYREYLGSEKVFAGTVTSAIGRNKEGEVFVEKRRGVGLAGESNILKVLIHEFASAGIPGRLYPDENSMKWSKVLTNLPSNAMSAILDMTPFEVYGNPLAYKLDKWQMKEAILVMRTLGIPITNLPGTPVRAMAWLYDHGEWPATRFLLQKGIGSGRGGKMPSFHIDLHSGRQASEVEYLNGAVVRYGKACGVPTPINHMLLDILTKLVKGEVKKEVCFRNPQHLFSLLPNYSM